MLFNNSLASCVKVVLQSLIALTFKIYNIIQLSICITQRQKRLNYKPEIYLWHYKPEMIYRGNLNHSQSTPINVLERIRTYC